MKPDTHIIYERLHAFDDVLQAVAVQLEAAQGLTSVTHTKTNASLSGSLVRGAFVLVLGVAVGSAGLFGSTHAYFNDLERSANNFFRAGLVRFAATTDVTEGSVGVGVPLALPIEVTPDPESILLQYQVSAQTDSQSAFCAAILADIATPVVYSGGVTGLAGLSTATGTWPFALSLSTEDGILPEDVCTVTVIYTGWDASKPVQSGFTDTRQLTVMLHPILTEEVVIEEVSVQSFSAEGPAPDVIENTPEVVEETPEPPAPEQEVTEPEPEPEPELELPTPEGVGTPTPDVGAETLPPTESTE